MAHHALEKAPAGEAPLGAALQFLPLLDALLKFALGRVDGAELLGAGEALEVLNLRR